jgi:hypothetical protein
MPISIIGTGSGPGVVKAETENDVTFNGLFITGGAQPQVLSHNDIVNGKAFTVVNGKFYSVVVIAIFAETGNIEVNCDVVNKKKSAKRSATLKDNNPVVKQVQFDIFA